MGHSDRQGTCEGHLHAILFHEPLHSLWSTPWSPCAHWEDCDNRQLSWLGSQMRTQSSFWKKKIRREEHLLPNFCTIRSLFSAHFFPFLLPLLFGGKWNKWSLLISQACSQRDMRRRCCWWSETSGVTLRQVWGQDDWILGFHWPTSLAKSVISRFRGGFLEIKK